MGKEMVCFECSVYPAGIRLLAKPSHATTYALKPSIANNNKGERPCRKQPEVGIKLNDYCFALDTLSLYMQDCASLAIQYR